MEGVEFYSFKTIIVAKNKTIIVKGVVITIIEQNNCEFISLTDMFKAKDGDFFISDWLRNRNTVEFLGIWESVYNPVFNYGEFAIIKNQAGLNNYKISAQWNGRKKQMQLGLKQRQVGMEALLPILISHLNLECELVLNSKFTSSKNFSALKKMKTAD